MTDATRYMLHVTRHKGYIVLTSVIILSAVLLLIAQTLSIGGYFQRRSITDFEYKEASYFSALSCVDRVVYKLSDDLDYLGNETFQIGSNTCTVSSITTVANPSCTNPGTYLKFIASSTVSNHTTNLTVVLDLYNAVACLSET